MRTAALAAAVIAATVACAFAGDVVLEEHPPQPYKFGYESQDEYGNAQSRHEQDLGDGVKTGSYGYRDAAGTFRHVNYVADGAGFRAWVRTNEPGTADSTPAAARIQRDAHHGTVAAPVVAAAAAPAPAVVAYAADAPSAPAYGAKLSTAAYVAGSPLVAPSQGLALAASGVVAAPAVELPPLKPVPVRKLVGPSAAAVAAQSAPVVAPVVARLTAVSPKLTAVLSEPVTTLSNHAGGTGGGLHTASSEAIVVAPAAAYVTSGHHLQQLAHQTHAVAAVGGVGRSASLHESRKPYEKFAETFRRRRPIKTIGDKEIFVPPVSLTAGGVPLYKDK